VSRPPVTARAELETLSDGELLARLRAIPQGGAEHERTCEILVGRYLGLVRLCVRRHRNSPEPAEDLMQVGYVGLLKAINNFDPAYSKQPSYPCDHAANEQSR